ncbi:MAG: hypothetical protein NZM28_04965 [Fimbriimonadales bacterium]|nr:hypothetical protein [Fimbriimonadales bacterium]
MQITVELNEAEAKQLERLAQQQGLTVADWAREVLMRETRLLLETVSTLPANDSESLNWTVEFVPVGENAFQMRILESGREVELTPEAGVGSVRSGRGDLSILHDDYFAEACT